MHRSFSPVANIIIAAKGQKVLVCGLTDWYIDPWRAAQRSLPPGEPLPTGTSLPEKASALPGGVLYCVYLSDALTGHSRMSCPGPLFRAKQAYTFPSVGFYPLMEQTVFVPLSHSFVYVVSFIGVNPETAREKTSKQFNYNLEKHYSRNQLKIFLLAFWLPEMFLLLNLEDN